MEISHILHIEEYALPIKYLGVSLTYDYIYIAHCTPLLSKISCKLQGWESQLLTIAGQAKLIHSTITPILMYWLLIYHLSLSVLKRVIRCVQIFLEWKPSQSIMGYSI